MALILDTCLRSRFQPCCVCVQFFKKNSPNRKQPRHIDMQFQKRPGPNMSKPSKRPRRLPQPPPSAPGGAPHTVGDMVISLGLTNTAGSCCGSPWHRRKSQLVYQMGPLKRIMTSCSVSPLPKTSKNTTATPAMDHITVTHSLWTHKNHHIRLRTPRWGGSSPSLRWPHATAMPSL